MKRALFKSVNLIGDALYISPALRAWSLEHPGWEVDIQTLNDHVARLYYGMGVPLRAIHYDRPKLQYDFEHNFDVNAAFNLSDQRQQHIAESYADLLGVDIQKQKDMSHVGPFYWPPSVITDEETATGPAPEEFRYKDSILVSMFSASCSSRGNPPGPPNKMLPWALWKVILKTVAKTFPSTPIWFLGAPTDTVPSGLLDVIPGGGYLTGIPLDKLARIMQRSKFVITLDNGMAHLAASQKTREFVFYPRALGEHYILPKGNPNMEWMHMDPNYLRPVEAIWKLQEAWKTWRLV